MIRIPGNNLIYYYCTKVPKKITYVAIHTIGQFVLDRMIFFITKPTSVQFFQEEEKQDRIGWKLFSCIQTTSDQRSPCISLVTWLLVWCHPTGGGRVVGGGGGGGVGRVGEGGVGGGGGGGGRVGGGGGHTMIDNDNRRDRLWSIMTHNDR